MPLKHGYAPKAIEDNIAKLVREGYPSAQAAAIAYNTARKVWREKHPTGRFPSHIAYPEIEVRSRRKRRYAVGAPMKHNPKKTAELKPNAWMREDAEVNDYTDSPLNTDIERKKSGKWSIPLFEIPYASGSEYSGGLVTRSNRRVIEEMAEGDEAIADALVFSDRGMYGSYATFIRLDDEVPEELLEVVERLENYPLLNENLHSEMEMEAEDEAWGSWALRDWKDALIKEAKDDAVEEAIDEMDDDDLINLYREAAEAANVYVEHEETGPYFDFDSVAESVDFDSFVDAEENPGGPFDLQDADYDDED